MEEEMDEGMDQNFICYKWCVAWILIVMKEQSWNYVLGNLCSNQNWSPWPKKYDNKILDIKGWNKFCLKGG